MHEDNGFKKVVEQVDTSLLNLPQNLALLTNDSFLSPYLKFCEDFYDSDKLDGSFKSANTSLPLNIWSYLNYLQKTNEPFYQDMISLPYF